MALLVCGLMILLVLTFPIFLYPFIVQVVIPTLSDCSSTKLLTIVSAVRYLQERSGYNM